MKYTWEPEDIIPGRGVVRPKISRIDQMKSYLIAYTHEMKASQDDAEARYFLVLVDEDGMCFNSQTKSGLADTLTTGGYIPVDVLAPQNNKGDIDGYGKFREIQQAFKVLTRVVR